jgi:hypothetical protein
MFPRRAALQFIEVVFSHPRIDHHNQQILAYLFEQKVDFKNFSVHIEFGHPGHSFQSATLALSSREPT